MLDTNEQIIIDEITDVGRKVDLLLNEARWSCEQLFRNAIIAYEAENFAEASKLFDEVRQKAMVGFNHTWLLLYGMGVLRRGK